MREDRRVALLISLLFGISAGFLFYCFFLQYPLLISKRSIFLSACVGSLLGFLINKLLTNLKFDHIIKLDSRVCLLLPIFSLLLTISLYFFINIPKNYLLAPQVNIEIVQPSLDEGGGYFEIEGISNGESYINLGDLHLMNNSRNANNKIIVFPSAAVSSVLKWEGKAWDRIYFTFSDYTSGSRLSFILNGKYENFIFPKDHSDQSVTTSLQVPSFSLILFLSTLSIFICLILFIFITSLSFYFLYKSKERVFQIHRLNHFAKYLLMLGLLFIIPWLFHYAWMIISNPAPAEYREGSILLMTSYLLKGINPYLLENHPLMNYNYGILYNLVVLPFARIFGNTFFIHRLISIGFIFLACLVFLSTLRKLGNNLYFSIAVTSLLMASLFFYITPIARPDGFGEFLFLSAILLPWLKDFEPAALIFSGCFGILSFFTKQYFVMSIAIVASYIFFFVSKKKGLIYGLISVSALILVSLTINQYFKTYILDTVINNYSIGESKWGWMVAQLRFFIEIYLPVIWILLISFLMLLDQLSLKIPELKKRIALSFNLTEINKPLINSQFNYFCYFFIIVTGIVVLKLGQHPGNYMTYFFQLITPALLIYIFQFTKFLNRFAIITAALLLFNIFFFCSNVLYPNDPGPYLPQWQEIINMAAGSNRILNSPLLVSYMVDQNLPIVDSGQTQYFYYTNPYPDTIFAPSYDRIIEQGKEYQNLIDLKIQEKYYESVIITKGLSPFVKSELLSNYYLHVKDLTIFLPQTDQDWIQEVWMPKIN